MTTDSPQITPEHLADARRCHAGAHSCIPPCAATLVAVIEADTRAMREAKRLLTEGDVYDYMAAWELLAARLSGRDGIGTEADDGN